MKRTELFAIYIGGVLILSSIITTGVLLGGIEILGGFQNKNVPNLPLSLAGNEDRCSEVQQWNVIWGDYYDYESINGIILDGAGFLYVVGGTDTCTHQGCDMYLAKYSDSGVLQWDTTWGGNMPDCGSDVAIDSAGNIYITGRTDSYFRARNAFLAKYNSSGALQWVEIWGGSDFDRGYGVAVDENDDIYITGSTESFGAGSRDMFLAKYNSSGTNLWNTTWGGNDNDHGVGISVDKNNDIYITGSTESFGAGITDIFLAKYSSSGKRLWNTTWGGSDYDRGFGVAVDENDDIYITGFTKSFGAKISDIFLAKYSSSGKKLWNTTWGGSDREWASGIATDGLGNILIVGETESFGAGDYDTFLLKYNSSGAKQCAEIWGSSDRDVGYDVAADGLGNIYIVGQSDLDFFIAKYRLPIHIDIISPEADTAFGVNAPNYTVRITHPALNCSWYTLNDGGEITFTENGTINPAEWASLEDGSITISFYANDVSGNTDSECVEIIKDTTPPTMNIISPSMDEVFGSDAPTYNVEISDLTLKSTWYSLNNGQSITFSSNGIINQSAWASQPDGSVAITFYANDTLGYTATETIIVKKETPAENGGNEIPGYLLFIFMPLAFTSIMGLIFFYQKECKL